MIFKQPDSKNGNGTGPKWKKRINDERAMQGYMPGRSKHDVNLNQIFKRKQTIRGVSSRLYSPEKVENAAALSREFYKVLSTSFNGNTSTVPNKLNTSRNYNGYGKNWPMTAMSLDTKNASVLSEFNDIKPSQLAVVEVNNKF